MSNIKPTIDAGVQTALENKYGTTFKDNLCSMICLPVSNGTDRQFLEALQMAEVAMRMQLYVREAINECRKLEQHEHMLETELEYLRSELMERKDQIRRDDSSRKSMGGIYRVYREAWRDFLYSLEWAGKRQGLEGQELRKFRKKIISMGRSQAKMIVRAEKASQMATAMMEQTSQPKYQKSMWDAL